MTTKPDPLAADLERSLNAETAAVARRFNDADRHTQGRPPNSPRAAAARAVVRASFSFPAEDHDLFDLLQQRSIAGGLAATRSELVRAGLRALHDLPPDRLARTLARLEKLRPGPRAGG